MLLKHYPPFLVKIVLEVGEIYAEISKNGV